MKMRRFWLLRALKIVLFATLLAAGLGEIVVHLWNWLMPEIFGVHAITFWQGVGLLVLGRILFGGFHRRPHGGRCSPPRAVVQV